MRGTERYTNMGLLIKEFTEPQAQVAVVTAGAIPYFAERPAVDLMGKSDAVIAREPMRTNLSRQALQDFRPGHTKWNYAYSITEQQPDVIAQLWDETTDEAQSYMAGDYRRVVFDEIPCTCGSICLTSIGTPSSSWPIPKGGRLKRPSTPKADADRFLPVRRYSKPSRNSAVTAPARPSV